MTGSLGVDNVGIAVEDLRESIQFYSSLGFTTVSEDTMGALIEQDAVRIDLFQSNGRNEARQRPLDMQDSAAGIDYISLAVDDLHSIHEVLQRSNISVESGPTPQPWGPTTITILDHNGVRFWFLAHAE